MNKKISLLVLIVGLAFFLRFYQVASIPPALYWDETAMALDAKAISLTGLDQHGNHWFQPIYPSWGDYKLPVYIISAVPFFKIIKNNPELTIRFPSAIAGTLTVLVIYFLVKELFKPPRKTPGFKFNPGVEELAAFLLAISPWHLQFSRAAFEGNLALFLNTLAVHTFLKARKNKIWLTVTILTTFLSIYTYYSSRIVLPILLLLTFIFFYKKNLKNFITLIGTGAIVFITIIPLYYSPLAFQAQQFRLSTKNIMNNPELLIYSNNLIIQDDRSFLGKKIHHRFLYQAKVLAAHYFDHFSLNYLLLEGDPNPRHSTGRIGVLLIAGFIGLILGEYYLFKSNIKIFIFLNLCLLISFLPASVPYEVPHSLRSLNGVIWLNIISAYGLVKLLFIPMLQSGPRAGLRLAGAIYCLLFTQIIFCLHDYYKHYPNRSYFSWQGGYKEAIKAVDRNYDKADKIIFSNIYARPYLYFLLYSNYPIKEFQNQRQRVISREPLNYSETALIDKVEFKGPLETDKETNKVILVGSPQEVSGKGAVVLNPAFNIWKNF